MVEGGSTSREKDSCPPGNRQARRALADLGRLDILSFVSPPVGAIPGLAAARIPRLLRGALRVPLFYKILVANIAIVLLGALAGTALTVTAVRRGGGWTTWELMLVFGAIGIVLSGLVNAVILRVALVPLRQLEDTARRVAEGDATARVRPSPLADRELEALIEMFNTMLNAVHRYRTQLRGIASRALHSAEDERRRISRELHDDTAQTLSALMVRLQVARDTKDPHVAERHLDEIRTELARAAESVRRFARALRPAALDELGVVAATSEYGRSLCAASGLDIDVSEASLTHQLDPDAELALYRIVQEALSNVVRHAEATKVGVTFEDGVDRIVATVRDDGRGFVPEEELDRTGGGLGLFGMRERAEYVGGSVTIESRPGRGTEVRVEIPIANRGEG